MVLAERPLNETALSDLDARDGDMSKRANHGVYLCVDAYWQGYCVHITSPSGVCGTSDIAMYPCNQFIDASSQVKYSLISVLP